MLLDDSDKKREEQFVSALCLQDTVYFVASWGQLSPMMIEVLFKNRPCSGHLG